MSLRRLPKISAMVLMLLRLLGHQDLLAWFMMSRSGDDGVGDLAVVGTMGGGARSASTVGGG